MLRQTQIDAFDKLLHSLDSINVLPAILIVGSWAEYLYKNCNILDYQLTMRTQDVDVLIKNKNIPRIAVNKVLKENGFILIPDQTGLTKFDYLVN